MTGMGRAVKVTSLLIDTVLASLVLTPLLGCPLLLALLGRQPAVRDSSLVFFEEPVLFPLVAFVAGEQELFSALGCFLGSFILPNEVSEHHSNSGEQSAWILLLLCFFNRRVGPGASALLFDNPVVHGCLFVACLVLFAWRLCIAALLCLVCLIVGERFRTITCRQIRLAHSSVCQGSHTLAHPSD